jgi:hypothetical protein
MPEDPTPQTIAALARQAGLDLPAAYQEELVSAYINVRRMMASLPAERSRGDEPAHVFVPARFQAAGKQ